MNPYQPPTVTAKTLPTAPAKPQRNHLSDFVAAGLLFGLILGGLAYMALTQLGNAPDIGGYPRAFALGIPCLVISIAFFLTGFWVFFSRSKPAVYSVCLVSFVMLLAEVVFELYSTGTLFAFKLISLVFYATPFLLLRSVGPALRQIDAERAASKAGE